MCIFSAILAFFFLPHIGQDSITKEDADFRAYLEEKGFDVTKLGDGGEFVGDEGVVSEYGQNETGQDAGGRMETKEKL